MPVPDLLDAFTLRAGFAAAITDPLDYSAGGPAGLLGAGLADPKTGLGGELTVVLYPGTVREVPYPFFAGELRVALAYDLANGQRVDVPLRIGAGTRTLFINDRKVLSGYKPEKQLGLEAETSDTTAFGGAGLRVYVAGRVHLRVDLDAAAHFGDLPTWQTSHTFWEFTPSISLELRATPVLDGDEDGLPDAQDACREVPEDRDGFEDQDGCPESDNDHDGVADEAEACDLDPEDMDGFRDGDGCPEPNNDLDEFPDATDGCPNQRESANGWKDGDGCSDILPDTLLDIELLMVEEASDPEGWAARLQAAVVRVTRALEAEPEARVMVLLHEVDIPTIAPMVTAFRANGLLPRVGFSREDGGWPLSRPEPGFWQASRGPLVVFAVVDPVDAMGKPVPFRAEEP